MSIQDKFGFYLANGQQFYSRLEAIQTGKPVTWVFNDTVYDHINWSKEPAETIENLYKQRAQQLRDKYDYLVLWFSGGADSTNILNSFVDNDIKLDEVASYVNYEATGDKFNFLNAEIYNVAAPLCETAKIKQPWLKHRLVDLAPLTVEFFSKTDSKFDWIYHMSRFYTPNSSARQDIKIKVKEWADMITSGKRVGFIHGIDKPNVMVNKNKKQAYFKFTNLIDTAVTANMQIMNRPWEFDELFYWDPECPLIPVKQAHMVKNYLNNVPTSECFIANTVKKRNNNTILIDGDKIYGVPIDNIHRIIYPKFSPALYQFKSQNIFLTPRDEWFFKLPESDFARKSWSTGLAELLKHLPGQNENTTVEDKSFFMSTLYSKLYNLVDADV